MALASLRDVPWCPRPAGRLAELLGLAEARGGALEHRTAVRNVRRARRSRRRYLDTRLPQLLQPLGRLFD